MCYAFGEIIVIYGRDAVQSFEQDHPILATDFLGTVGDP